MVWEAARTCGPSNFGQTAPTSGRLSRNSARATTLTRYRSAHRRASQQHVVAVGRADADVQGSREAEIARETAESHFGEFVVEAGGAVARPVVDNDYLEASGYSWLAQRLRAIRAAAPRG